LGGEVGLAVGNRRLAVLGPIEHLQQRVPGDRLALVDGRELGRPDGQEDVVERNADDDREDGQVEERPAELAGIPPHRVGEQRRSAADQQRLKTRADQRALYNESFRHADEHESGGCRHGAGGEHRRAAPSDRQEKRQERHQAGQEESSERGRGRFPRAWQMKL
jgi:hypothetical protein